MSDSHDGYDYGVSGQEIKNAFVTSLIRVQFQLEELIFRFRGQHYKILDGLKGIILSLDEDSQKKLKKQLDKIYAYLEGKDTVHTDRDIDELYSEIAIYLHKTYLKEVRFARPKFGKGSMTKTKKGTP